MNILNVADINRNVKYGVGIICLSYLNKPV